MRLTPNVPVFAFTVQLGLPMHFFLSTALTEALSTTQTSSSGS